MGAEYNYCIFINSKGEVVTANCKFKVICLNDVHIHTQGDILLVSSVIHTVRGIIIYVIQGELYYHYHFALYDTISNTSSKN